MFGAIAGGIASALAGGAMSKLFGGGQKAASGGIQGDVLATDNNTVGMGDAGIKSAIQGSNVPNPDEAVPSFEIGRAVQQECRDRKSGSAGMPRSEERFSRNAETELVCRLLLEKKNNRRCGGRFVVRFIRCRWCLSDRATVLGVKPYQYGAGG